MYGYSELLKDIERLRNKYRGRLEAGTYGVSEQGRRLLLISVGRGEKKHLIAGGIHGREAVSSLFVMKCLEDYLENCLDDQRDSCLFACPMANPDGVEIFYSREKPFRGYEGFVAELFKNNANNVNLNANFPFMFSCVPKSRLGGSFAASEKETKALMDLCEKNEFEDALSVHARGNCIFWRDKGNGEVKGDLKLARSLEKGCGFELVAPTESAEAYSGGFENWFRYRFKRPALCVELVKNEEITYIDMCRDFYRAVCWDNTKNLLTVLTNTENLPRNQNPVTKG